MCLDVGLLMTANINDFVYPLVTRKHPEGADNDRLADVPSRPEGQSGQAQDIKNSKGCDRKPAIISANYTHTILGAHIRIMNNVHKIEIETFNRN